MNESRENIWSDSSPTIESRMTFEAESSVIGAVFLEPDVFDEIRSKPEDFTDTRIRTIFEGMIEIKQKGYPLDLVTIMQHLDSKDMLEPCGGAPFILELSESCPTAANISYYDNIVREQSRNRKAKKAAIEYINNDSDLTDLMMKLEDLDTEESNHEGYDAYELSTMFFELMNSNGEQYIMTGMKDLDNILDGIKKTDVIVVGARPSVGKTAFAVNLIDSLTSQDVGVSLFNYEMGESEITRRMVSVGTGIELRKLKKPERMDVQEMTRAMNYMSVFSKKPLISRAAAGMNIYDVKVQAKRDKRRLNKKHHVIIIDHLHIIPSYHPRMSENESLTHISRICKEMAVELQTPVILLAQLNRALEQRQDKRPIKSDLRSSGAIEQDADTIMFLHRENYFEQDQNENDIMEVIVSKQRDGQLGKAEFLFKKEQGRLVGLEIGR